MTTRLERKILTGLGVVIFCFFVSTMHIFQHISSSEDIKNNIANKLHFFEHSGTATLNGNVHASRNGNGKKNKVSVFQMKSPKEAKASIKKIPFPQTIKNEQMISITHPAVDAMEFVHSLQENESGNGSGSGDEMEAEVEEEEKGETSNNKMIMVPKFWDPPSLFKDGVRTFLGNYGERLITPEEARAIGSVIRPIEEDKEEDLDAGEYYSDSEDEQKEDAGAGAGAGAGETSENENETDLLLETIFVSIASYRDYRCSHTVEQLFKQAKYPERIRVAIVDQLDPKHDKRHCIQPKRSCTEYPDDILCKYSHLMDIYVMDATLAVGPVFARHIGYRMYRGEYYAMQSDAHMEFVNGWDVDVISQWKEAENEMAVLSTYVSDVAKHYNKTTGYSYETTRPMMCNTDFVIDYYDNRLANLQHGQQPEGNPSINGQPTLHPFWAAGFSFARGHFLIQVPYDQYLPMIFQGEEITIGLRGFTYGYDYYAPERSVLFHYYSHGSKDKKVKKFWEHSEDYNGVEAASMARLLAISKLLPSVKKDVVDQNQKKEEGGMVKVNKDEENKGKVDTTTTTTTTSADILEEIVWNDVEEKQYGVGNVRTVDTFLHTFGIDITTQTVQHHLCSFVGTQMNTLFLAHLRGDKMGINYDAFSYQWVDPHPDEVEERR